MKLCKCVTGNLCFQGLLLAFAIGGSGFSSTAWGWGAKGHQIVARVGSELAQVGQGFWTPNSSWVVKMTNVPDQYWKQKSYAFDEKPTHFFEPDGYFSSENQFSKIPLNFQILQRQYDAATIRAHGTALWRVKQFFDLAVEAFKSDDSLTAIQMAGAMSHYVGDLSQPLHVTTNYDGQDTDQKGIHAYFETTNIGNSDLDEVARNVMKLARQKFNDKKFRAQFRGSVIDSAFSEMDRAYLLKDELLDIDTRTERVANGVNIELLKLAEERMADGAASLAILLEQVWAEAGVSYANVPSRIDIPDFIMPDYGGRSTEGQQRELNADDCDLE